MYTPQALRDQIFSLPRATSPLASNQFSGYFDISSKKHIHYYYVESERDPANDDIFFWTNGGPGCSGLLGLFTEMGPWRPKSDGTLVRNPASWTVNASFVFLEQPVNVGFSYATTSVKYSDYLSSVDNLLTLKAFYARYPERSNNSFYIASESYGGHYIPQLALAILDDTDVKYNLVEKFGGYLLGNPYTSFASGYIGMALTLWGMQLVSKPKWDIFLSRGCHSFDLTYSSMPKSCWSIWETVISQSESLNEYSLTFPTCVSSEGGAWQHNEALLPSYQTRHIFRSYHKAFKEFGSHLILQNQSSIKRDHKVSSSIGSVLQKRQKKYFTSSPNTLAYDPCTEDYTVEYLSDYDVQVALHIIDPGKKRWAVCSDPVFYDWPTMDQFANTEKLYSQIITHNNLPSNFKMLIFSGDVDSVCGTVSTQDWIYSVIPKSLSYNSSDLWNPWFTFDGQLGGFSTLFSDKFAFVTVHGAGHEVPAYQPLKASVLFGAYLDGSLFKTYVEEPKLRADDSSSNRNNKQLVVAIIIAAVLAVALTLAVLTIRYYSKSVSTSKNHRPPNKDFQIVAIDAAEDDAHVP